MKRLNKILGAIEQAVIAVDSLLLVAITVIIVIQVIARKMNISLSGTEELARYAYVIFAYLAWPLAALRGTDICITFLFDKFPKKARVSILALFHTAMAVFAGMCFYSMLKNIETNRGIVATSNPWLKVSWIYVIVAVGLMATAIFNLIRGYMLLTGEAVYISQEEKDMAEIEEAKRAFQNTVVASKEEDR